MWCEFKITKSLNDFMLHISSSRYLLLVSKLTFLFKINKKRCEVLYAELYKMTFLDECTHQKKKKKPALENKQPCQIIVFIWQLFCSSIEPNYMVPDNRKDNKKLKNIEILYIILRV